jgi:hypothetical protein
MKKFYSVLKSVVTLLFLTLSVPLVIYGMQNQNFEFKVNAFLTSDPQTPMVVDIRGNSVKIVWMTEKEVMGSIKINELTNKIAIEKESVNYHMVEVKALQANTTYTYSILSDGVTYTDPSYKFTTSSTMDIVETSKIVIGQVFNKDGVSLQQKGLVLVQLTNKSGKISQKIPALLNKAGGYQVNLAGIYNSDSKGIFNSKGALDIDIYVYSEIKDAPVVKKYSADFSATRQIPNIYLGDINIDIIPGINGK